MGVPCPLLSTTRRNRPAASAYRFVLNAKKISFAEIKLDLLAGDQLKPDYLALNPNGVVPTLRPLAARNSRIAMGLNWASVKADHVTQACEMLLHSAVPRSKLGSNLVVSYRGKHLPAKAVLRLAYCLANNIGSEKQLKFASGETSIQRLRSLGFQAERFKIDNPTAKKG
jgi:hypothetical protein